MATAYELIDSSTLGSDTASVTFSSIPATFDDLVLLLSIRGTRPDFWTYAKIRFNGASVDTNLSARMLSGDGSSAGSSSYSYGMLGIVNAATSDANTFSSVETYIPNYLSSTNKSFSSTFALERNNATNYMGAAAGLWSSTSAISGITVVTAHNSIASGSSFYLYGVTHA